MASPAIIAVQVVVVIVLFVLYGMDTMSVFRKLKLYFPHASVLILVGVAVGGVLEAMDEVSEVFAFEPSVFFNVLLPPIVFYSGLTLPKETFFRNIASISCFAFVGTIVASFVLGGLIYVSGPALDLDLSFTNSMVLGSLLAAVDPVSTISIFKACNVPVSLYTLVMGESVLNDAVSIVVNREFVQLAEDESRAVETSMAKALGLIVGVTLGSVVLGVVLGVISALVHKHSELRKHHHLELAAFVSIAYLSFVVAEETHLSGIMCSLLTGVMMDHYSTWNLSEQTKHATHSLFEMLAEVAEAFVFVYTGMAVFTFDSHAFKLAFSVCVFLYCIVARFASVYPIGFLLNLKRKRPIPTSQQHVMFLSGLRGAVAFALALESPKHRDAFVTTTLFQVFVTIFVFGGMTYPTLKFFGLSSTEKQVEARRARVSTVAMTAGATAVNPVSKTAHWFVRHDRDYFRKWLRVPEAAEKLGSDADLLAIDPELFDNFETADIGTVPDPNNSAAGTSSSSNRLSDI